jgi:DNA primase
VSRVAQASLDEVKERADIVEVVRAHTPLQRRGAEWTGRCPFHEERSPSFWVNPDTKLYYCFGCGAKGDLISFVCEAEGLDFAGAVELLADRFGVELQYDERDPQAAERRSREERLYEILRTAAAFYERILWERPEAERARAYLEERGIEAGTARRFGLGFSLDEWDRVVKAARGRGFSERELQDAGLARPSDRGRGMIDRFRGRLMFPLRDGRGRVVGFGARRLPPAEDGPKYLNSPEGPVWHKGDILYGLDLAKRAIGQRDLAIVVEGYTDVLGLVQAGIPNVVASMGTSLTERQLRELRRLSRHVVLFFDADAAGADAALRGLQLAGREGLEVRIASLPEGRDPADAAKADPASVEAAIAGARSVVAFRVELALDRADLSSAAGRDASLPLVREALSGAPPSIERAELQRLAAGRLRLTPELEASLVRGSRKAVETASGQRRQPLPQQDPAVRDERLLLALSLAAGPEGREILGRMDENCFTEPLHRAARAWILRRLGDEKPAESDAAVAAELEPELGAIAAREAGNPAALEEAARRLEARAIEGRMETLKRKLSDADVSREALQELKHLQARAHQLKELATRAGHT